jgi:AcrR family transcriptional regulator
LSWDPEINGQRGVSTKGAAVSEPDNVQVRDSVVGPSRGTATTARGSARAKRRDDIIAAAVQLFSRKGYTNTSITDIGAAMGLTGPAVYRYFEGKEQILVAALDSNWERLSRSMAHVVQLPEPDCLNELVREYTEMTVDDGIYFLLWQHERHRLPPSYVEHTKRKQHLYISEWVHILHRVRPELSEQQAHLLVHAAFALMHSTANYRGIPPAAAKRTFTELTLQLMMSDSVTRD